MIQMDMGEQQIIQVPNPKIGQCSQERITGCGRADIDHEGGRTGMQPDADELVKSRQWGRQGDQVELFAKLPYDGEWHVFSAKGVAA